MTGIICFDIHGPDSRCVSIGERRPECDPRCGQDSQPMGYVDRAEWAEMMLKTHVQLQCPGCNLWSIWEPIKNEGGE